MPEENTSSRKIRPFDPSKITNIEDALVALQGCSFQGRNLGNALEVLTKMVEDQDCLRVLTISGAMVPAGMEEIISQMIEKKIIGAIITTGANITHSFINVLGNDGDQVHYMADSQENDHELSKKHVYRVYDTLVQGDKFEITNKKIFGMIQESFPDMKRVTILPSELFEILGKKLEKRCFIKVAADHGVPIFCGAVSDSEFGLNLMRFREVNDFTVIMDEIGDIGKFSKILDDGYSSFGTIILGGGVPRNWAQQIFPYLRDLEDALGYESRFRGYQYSVRFHTAVPYDGGLSGCTISESISWGKYDPASLNQSIWGDSTVYFPILITGLFQRMKRLGMEAK